MVGSPSRRVIDQTILRMRAQLDHPGEFYAGPFGEFITGLDIGCV
jgi:hypothetical protein